MCPSDLTCCLNNNASYKGVTNKQWAPNGYCSSYMLDTYFYSYVSNITDMNFQIQQMCWMTANVFLGN